MPDRVAQAAAILKYTQYAVALTGAGISTPSGIPDFRSEHGGLWKQIDPMEVASLTSFRLHPERFYNWVVPLAKNMQQAQPNPAHFALARLERLGILQSVITQNVDSLHTCAGSQTVREVHGHMRELTCLNCFRVYPAEPLLQQLLAADHPYVLHCEVCGGVLKPNVILFGEQLPYKALEAAEQDVRRCEVMIAVGTYLEVYPVADLPRRAKARGAKLIIVNYEPTSYDRMADVVIHGDVAEVLPRIVEAVETN